MTLSDEMLERYAQWMIVLLRDLNSAIFVMQEIPDWQEKYEAAKANALLNEKIDRVEALSRTLVECALGRREESPEVLELIDRLRKALHEPTQ